MTDVAPETIDRVRSVCLRLPEAYEEQAWVGTRWLVRKKTFAHILMIDAGYPPAYARAAGTDGPACVLTFRSPELDLEKQGPPFFYGGWGRNVIGLELGDDVDWDEVAELLVESYCLLAPKKLAEQVDYRGMLP